MTPTQRREEQQDPIVNKLLAVVEILSAVEGAGLGQVIVDKFRVGGGVDTYLSVIGATKQIPQSSSVIKFLRPGASPSSIVAQLTRKAKEGNLTTSDGRAIAQMGHVPEDWTWTGFVAAVEERLPATAEPKEITVLVRSLLALRKHHESKEASTSLSKLTMRGLLLNSLYIVQSAGDVIATALILVVLSQLLPEGGPEAHVGNGPSGLAYYQQVLDAPQNYSAVVEAAAAEVIGLDDVSLVLFGKNPKTLPLRRAVSQYIIDSDKKRRLFSPAVIVDYFPLVRYLAGDDLPVLVEEPMRDGSLTALARQTEFSSDLAGLYLVMLESADGEESDGLRQTAAAGLREIDEATWRQELNKPGDVLKLALRIAASPTPPDLDGELLDPLRKHAESLIGEENSDSAALPGWATLTKLLSRDARETLFRNLRDAALRNPREPLSFLLAHYGDPFARSEAISEELDEVVRRLLSEMLARRTPNELAWMGDVISNNEPRFRKIPKESREDFAARLQRAFLDSTDSEVSQDLVDVARIADVALPEREDSAEGDDDSEGEGPDSSESE